ncbi:MAG: GNAT family N-acetyltransferase [Campylobacteraceae bacterium]|nr:GNAT family N-acetyltransferase [Campylobacteraceae bacterium]
MLDNAKLEDLKQLVEIEESMFEKSKYVALTEKEWLRLLKKNSSKILVWRDGDTICGYALGIVINKNHIWFNSLAVLKKFQSTPIAKTLFDAIESLAKELELKTIILEIRADNKALFRRYTGFGYKIFKLIENYYPDGCNAIRMIKKMEAF